VALFAEHRFHEGTCTALALGASDVYLSAQNKFKKTKNKKKNPKKNAALFTKSERRAFLVQR